MFWPDSPEPQARTNLRQALHHLRHALGDPEACIRFTNQALQWRPDAAADVDVIHFERLVGDPGPSRHAAFGAAAALYRGDLLAGFYDDWVEPFRQRLHRRYRDAL